MPVTFLKNLTARERTSRSNRQLGCLLALIHQMHGEFAFSRAEIRTTMPARDLHER